MIPGPTQYDVRTNMINKKPFTLKGRPLTRAQSQKALGPGQYPIKSLFGQDNCLFLSNVKFEGGAKINPLAHSQSRARNKQTLISEPNIQYDYKYQIQPNGKYYNSKFRNIACPKIVYSINSKNENKGINIGPGEYILPSDFGIYQSSLFSKEETKKKLKL